MISIIFLCFGAVVVTITPILICMHRRRDKLMMQSIDWQIEKSRRIAAGWRPSLWDDDASPEEKQKALRNYMEGWKDH